MPISTQTLKHRPSSWSCATWFYTSACIADMRMLRRGLHDAIKACAMRIREIVDVKSQQLTQQIDQLKQQKRQLRASKAQQRAQQAQQTAQKAAQQVTKSQ